MDPPQPNTDVQQKEVANGTNTKSSTSVIMATVALHFRLFKYDSECTYLKDPPPQKKRRK